MTSMRRWGKDYQEIREKCQVGTRRKTTTSRGKGKHKALKRGRNGHTGLHQGHQLCWGQATSGRVVADNNREGSKRQGLFTP